MPTMPTRQARTRAWKRTRPALPPPPLPPSILATSSDPDDEDEALCARYEQELTLLSDGETEQGCDFSEGALASGGCLW